MRGNRDAGDAGVAPTDGWETEVMRDPDYQADLRRYPRRPFLKDDVALGASAEVLGGVRIGRGAKVGAMSVVLCDGPPGATAVGVPARVIGRGDACVARLPTDLGRGTGDAGVAPTSAA